MYIVEEHSQLFYMQPLYIMSICRYCVDLRDTVEWSHVCSHMIHFIWRLGTDVTSESQSPQHSRRLHLPCTLPQLVKVQAHIREF